MTLLLSDRLFDLFLQRPSPTLLLNYCQDLLFVVRTLTALFFWVVRLVRFLFSPPSTLITFGLWIRSKSQRWRATSKESSYQPEPLLALPQKQTLPKQTPTTITTLRMDLGPARQSCVSHHQTISIVIIHLLIAIIQLSVLKDLLPTALKTLHQFLVRLLPLLRRRLTLVGQVKANSTRPL